MSSGSFDIKSLQKYLNPQAGDDLSRFLDTVPGHVGKGTLMAAGIVWACAACLGLFTVMQAKQVTELRAQLQSVEAVKPLVPTISMVAAPADDISRFTDRLKAVYPTLNISGNNDGITISSKQTADFSQFREAVGHTVNGGQGWRVNISSLCIGRECKDSGLSAKLKIQKLNIDKPTS